MKKTFVFPNFDVLKDLLDYQTQKIAIVSIIGKSSFNSLGLKAKSIGKVFTAGFENDQEFTIEGHFDEENQLLYLHLHSLLDTDILVQQYQSLLDRCKTPGYLTLNDEIKSNFARVFLLLLYISHIIVLSNPTLLFDTNYIQYFKAADILSQKFNSKIVDSIKDVENLALEWVTNGRFCTPRLIFYFEKCPKGVYNLKRLEHNLEDRIYNVLKRTRIISNYNHSLFAIPLNEEFVFVQSKPEMDELGAAVRGLIEDCQPGSGIKIEAPYSSQPWTENSFIKFLEVHIMEAKHKGFNDTGGSSRHATYFELPTLKKWVETTEILYNFIVKSRVKPFSILCTDSRFSEQRCLKVLPLAIARYQENLPMHYSHSEHERRLQIAITLFSAQARGSHFQHFLEKLKRDCIALWENGKQQCEVPSMTGNPCKLPRHLIEEEHKSGFIYKCACDCGRKVGQREDPYNAKQANYDFYNQIKTECINCQKLERIDFSIYDSTVDHEETNEFLQIFDEKLVLNQSTAEKTKESKPTSYLSGMLTLTSPPSLLPMFSSWSLICLGPSSLYSHNLGLSDSHHPGFLTTTNYLLPWDVTVKTKNQNWSNQTKFSQRGQRRGRGTSAAMNAAFSVKVFIGVEYECQVGHRFMMAAPDKLLKATPGSIVKETGHKVAESSMPLWHSCVCRGGKMAQLMRLHVVTPKAPVNCTLNPSVQPAPGSPIFVPTHCKPIKLTQSAYWVMRLPYVYVDESEHWAQNAGGKLLKGVFGVKEIVE